jgi:hypothetical protein
VPPNAKAHRRAAVWRVRCSARFAGSAAIAEILLQQQTLVTMGVVVHDGQQMTSTGGVKLWRLEVERGEDHLLAVAASGFLLSGLEESCADALSTPRLFHPPLPDLAAAAPGIGVSANCLYGFERFNLQNEGNH